MTSCTVICWASHRVGVVPSCMCAVHAWPEQAGLHHHMSGPCRARPVPRSDPPVPQPPRQPDAAGAARLEPSPAIPLPMQNGPCPSLHPRALAVPGPDAAACPRRCSLATTAPCAAGLSRRTASPSSRGGARTTPACASGTPKQGPAPALSRAMASTHKVLPVHHPRQRAPTLRGYTAGSRNEGEQAGLLPGPPALPALWLLLHGRV